jgi:hypothetical protein
LVEAESVGDVAIWFMNGAQAQYVPVANVNTVWSVQGANAA